MVWEDMSVLSCRLTFEPGIIPELTITMDQVPNGLLGCPDFPFRLLVDGSLDVGAIAGHTSALEPVCFRFAATPSVSRADARWSALALINELVGVTICDPDGRSARWETVAELAEIPSRLPSDSV